MVEVIKKKALKIQHDLKVENECQRDKLMEKLTHNGQCRDIIRMDATSFLNLCFLLEEKGGLRPNKKCWHS
jgi:hypothetical protein